MGIRESRIVAVVGNETEGYSGDGKLSTSAQLFRPYGVAVDKAGNIYVSDTCNNCIRKVLMTLAPAAVNQQRNIFIDKHYVYLKSIAPGVIVFYTLDGKEPTQSSFIYHEPFCITETTTVKLRVYDPNTGFWSATTSTTFTKIQETGNIMTIAGDGTAGYSGDGGAATYSKLNRPSGIAVDSAGNIYIADKNNHRVRKIDLNGNITSVAGIGVPGYSGDGSPADKAKLIFPSYVALDSKDNLYIADSFNNCIRKVDRNGIIETVAGNGRAGYSGDLGIAKAAQLQWPNGIGFDKSDNLFIADSYNHCIRKVDKDGIITTVAGNNTEGYSGDGGQASKAQLSWPIGVSIDNEGNILVSDNRNNCIRIIDSNGVISTIAASRILNGPNGIALDNSNNLYIVDTYNNCIRKMREPLKYASKQEYKQKNSTEVYGRRVSYLTGTYSVQNGHIVESVLKSKSLLEFFATFVLFATITLIQ